jgi:hypothetical protein
MPRFIASQLSFWGFFIICCLAYEIRSPPPFQEIISAPASCSGRLRGWQWDRCSIDGAVVWTAMAFGHNSIAGPGGRVYGAPHTMGGHIQYSPFTAEQPFILNFDTHANSQQTFHLPPMVFSVYIQSEVLHSLLWHPKMTIFLSVLDNPSSEDDFESGWRELTAHALFDCDCNATGTLRDGLLSFKTNTEYTADNLMFSAFRDMFPEVPISEVYWLNARANVEAHVSHSTDDIFFSTSSLMWELEIAVAFNHPKLPHARSHKKAIATPKRALARLVSHKMCESMAHGETLSSQSYDARMQTVSSFYQGSTGNVSMTVLSASVTHDRHARAVAEFLVWFEVNDRCGEIMDHGTCMASSISDLNLSCSVRGISVPAHVETHQYMMNGHPRERVVSCSFKSSAFSLDDHNVDVHFADASTSLQAVVPLCSLLRDRQIQKIVACAQAIYNAALLETRWPGILKAWVLYHARLSCISRLMC